MYAASSTGPPSIRPPSTPLSPTQPVSRFVRTAALCCIAGGLIATIGAAVTAIVPSAVPLNDVSKPYTPAVFTATQILWAISYALIAIGIAGVARSDAAGSSLLGKIGLWIAILGKVALVVGNIGYALIATAQVTDPAAIFLDTLMGTASMVTALGLTLAGIVVLRVGRWQGWHRLVVLLCGLFVLVVLLPILMLELMVIQWPVAGWGACFVLLGIALYQQATRSAAGDLEGRMAVATPRVQPTRGS